MILSMTIMEWEMKFIRIETIWAVLMIGQQEHLKS